MPAPGVYPERPETINPCKGLLLGSTTHTPLNLAYADRESGIWLYNDNCLAVMDAISRKYPDGIFDMIFADPPYFLSNGGITCQAGKMVKVDKGAWDKSRGAEMNHEFNLEWLRRCQRVLKPNGTIWVSGTQHVIFSVGLQNPERHHLGKAQSASQFKLPLLHAFDRDGDLGGQEREEQTFLQLPIDEGNKQR